MSKIEDKLEDLLAETKFNNFLKKKEVEEKKKPNVVVIVLAIIGALVAIAGIAYAAYRFFTPDGTDDFEDEFDDDFDNDFFDEDDDIEPQEDQSFLNINRIVLLEGCVQRRNPLYMYRNNSDMR